MKRYSFISYFALIIFASCDQKQENSEPDISHHFPLSGILDYFPNDIFKINTIAVFYNGNGDELLLDLVSQTSTDSKTIGDKTYSIESRSVSYLDPNDPSYTLKISLSTSVNSPSSAVEFLYAALHAPVNGGYTPNIKLNNEGKPLICIYEEQRQLLGKTFDRIYSNFKADSSYFTSYTEIHYSPDDGIIAFVGIEGELWVLKEYR